MSKSNSSTRSNSVDTTAECITPDMGSPRGVTPVTEDPDELPQDRNDDLTSISLPSASPPPSYNYVLEEVFKIIFEFCSFKEILYKS